MSYISRAGTFIWHWICWCAATLFLVIVYPLALFALVAWLLLDLFPSRASKPLTSQTRTTRLLQHPRRDGARIYVENPDGTEIDIDILMAKNVFMEWADVFGGFAVYEKTKL